MIIAVGATKGGAGKSTTAINLAVAELTAGRSVLLVDTDLQGTARDWMNVRLEGEGRDPEISFLQVTGKQTFDLIQERAEKFESVIVDCGGRATMELQLSLAAADVIVVPVQPSNADSWALSDTITAITRARDLAKTEIPAAAFVSRGSTNVKDKEAADLVDLLRTVAGITVLDARTSERKVYRDALAAGLGVLELQPRTKKEAPAIEKAQAEILALRDAIMNVQKAG